ncbi:MAG: hypothetical protein ABEK29_04205 [Bradymonadaceae bacterium]
MRHTIVAVLFVSLGCTGCGQSPGSADESSPDSDNPEGFSLEGTVTAGDDEAETVQGGGFSLSGHLEASQTSRIVTGDGWRLELDSANPRE